MGLRSFFGIFPLRILHEQKLPYVDMRDAVPENLSRSVADFVQEKPTDLRERLRAFGFGFDAGMLDARTVIVSACDIDPGVTIQQHVISLYPEAFIRGLGLLQHILQPKKIVFTVFPRQRKQAQSLAANAAEVVVINPVYPNGFPDVLAARVARARPGAGSSVFISAERLVAMAQALAVGSAPTTKLVSLLGSGFPQRKNICVRLGTSVQSVLESQGIAMTQVKKVICGGVLTGNAIFQPHTFHITNQTDAIIVQTDKELVHYESAPCFNCGKCTAVCPAHLKVNHLARYAEYSRFEQCKEYAIHACIGCGLCSYVCPAHRPLLQMISFAASELKKEQEAAA